MTTQLIKFLILSYSGIISLYTAFFFLLIEKFSNQSFIKGLLITLGLFTGFILLALAVKL